MSTRCRNDLIGCRSRLQSTLSKWNELTAEVRESWKDSTADEFFRTNLNDIEPTLMRMMVALQEAADLVSQMEKKVADHDAYD
jgi:uncharacterized protein YukE